MSTHNLLPSGNGITRSSAREERDEEEEYLAWRRKNPRSYAVYILLCLFFGTLGIHDLYAGRTGSGIFTFLFTILLTIITVGTLGLGLIILAPWCLLCIILGLVHKKDADGIPMR